MRIDDVLVFKVYQKVSQILNYHVSCFSRRRIFSISLSILRLDFDVFANMVDNHFLVVDCRVRAGANLAAIWNAIGFESHQFLIDFIHGARMLNRAASLLEVLALMHRILRTFLALGRHWSLAS